MNEAAILFNRENTPTETMEISGNSVRRIGAALDRIYGHHCDNCGRRITGVPIEVEVEINICPDGIEMDVPVTRYMCSEECKNEFI